MADWRFERDLRTALARVRHFKLPPVPRRARVSPAALVVHAPVDVAHWLPNMPRGSEAARPRTRCKRVAVIVVR